MVIVRLHGGLGNQMFQYAVGKSLSSKLGVPLGLDIRDLTKGETTNDFTFRKYELNYFSIEGEVFLSSPSFLGGFFFKYFSKYKRYVEPSFYYDSSFNKLKDNVYLDGFWQSEKYFNNIRSELVNDFQINKPFSLSEYNCNLINRIQSINSVSLHIRRGDYVSNSEAAQVHGVCSLEYYFLAIEYILNYTENPKLFIFSDDILWAKDNFDHLNLEIEFVEGNLGDDSYIDLHLMRLCKHNIIANSTFSWWAAWLNQNSSKIVIAPKTWFNSGSIDSRDLIPPNWIRL